MFCCCTINYIIILYCFLCERTGPSQLCLAGRWDQKTCGRKGGVLSASKGRSVLWRTVRERMPDATVHRQCHKKDVSVHTFDAPWRTIPCICQQRGGCKRTLRCIALFYERNSNVKSSSSGTVDALRQIRTTNNKSSWRTAHLS